MVLQVAGPALSSPLVHSEAVLLSPPLLSLPHAPSEEDGSSVVRSIPTVKIVIHCVRRHAAGAMRIPLRHVQSKTRREDMDTRTATHGQEFERGAQPALA